MNAIPQAPIITPEEATAIARVTGMVVPGRACGTCTLCCKVLDIAALEKPTGKWCSHCTQGNGCGIHAMRPVVCRGFYCEWMIAKGLGPEWKPERSKFLLSKADDGQRLTAHIDPGYPSAWRASPYYQNFKIWASEGGKRSPMQMIAVMVGNRVTVVLPDRDVEFGILEPGERLQLLRDAKGAMSVNRIPA